MKMKKPLEARLGRLGLEADHFPFNGLFEVENDFLSEISFYDYGDDSTADELDESHDIHLSKKKQARSIPTDGKKAKLAKTNTSRVRDGEKHVLKKIQKGRKSRIESSDEQSASDADVKSDSDACEEPYSFVGRQPKLPKKLRAGTASFGEFEGDVKVQRKGKVLETTPKRRGTVPSDGKFGSGFGGENARDSKVKEEILMESSDVREGDRVNGKTAVQAFQKKKKLCKAADLKPAGEKGHKGKNKGYFAEMKQKTGDKGSLIGKDHSSMKSIQKNRLKDYNSESEDTAKASPRKNFKQGLVKEQKFSKDEDGLTRAAITGDGQSIPLVRKSLVGTGHAVKNREFKHEDVAGSSSTGKRQGPNQHLMPSVVRSKKKVGQATKDLCISLETVHSVVDHQRHVLEKVCDNGVTGEEVSSGVTEGAEGNKDHLPDEKGNINAEVAGTKVGWVMCDSCKKWRCIPASLIDMIDSTNCGWFCKDNPNKKFADCSVPQEKTNAEINRELNLSEVSFCEEGDEKHPAIDSTSMNGVEHQSRPQSTWTLIKHNIFQHRHRKTETLDEQMVCMCKPPKDGSLGCGEDCHNRMLNIECVSQTCPCGDACSNQQFQGRLYKKVNWFRCGKKGFGLQVLEDVPKGAFIIEYVGEVLNVASYEARQKQYALGGQKHFYFMTLSGSEIIDACYKGNLGRFINHSCEPNCTTEKWMVNGEVCIGLFAVRDLKKGEEITFDYNFVRVCGAAAKKCLCGSRDCRGFIGGDPTTPQSVIHSESDEDDPEPVMIEESSEDESRIEDSTTATHRRRDEKIEPLPPLDLQNNQRNLMRNEVSERQAAILKQVKTKASIKTLPSANIKRLTVAVDGGYFEGVEEKLDKLVDENGGLRKGTPGVALDYKKLLWQTYNSVDASNGEGSRSTRDLSLLLDALLKTQSRAILLEFLNPQGFQMIHKMMKQSIKDYKRTPIIRKLLKVLEVLASRRILTVEQINAEPTHSSSESVKDTILELCRHADMEVQQMATHLKEKYLKGSSQKLLRRGQGLSDLSKWRLFPKQNQQESSGAGVADETTRKRKRASRWDQPSQEVLDTTLAGGLPQSFWPFHANNLLVGTGQQGNLVDHGIRQMEGASADELGAMHPGPPSFPVPDNQLQDEAAHVETAVVSGIPVEQFTAGSTMGYMSQQGPICIGIPVSQFHGANATGSGFPYMPQMLTSTHQVNHPSDGQALPFGSNMADVQEHRQHEFDVESTGKDGEEPDITFGISHSQFFQQMHGIFGSAFHPWQLQSLMAPHAWGPFLAGDARLRDLGFINESGPTYRQSSEYRGPEEMASKPAEPSGALGFVQEAEPPVPGLSPPLHPPANPPSFAYPSPSGQGPKRINTRPFTGNEYTGRNNMPHQQLKSSGWKPQRWNSPRWQKFPGNTKYRNPGFRRDFNYTQRNNRQTFGRQGPMRPHDNWEDYSSRKHPDRSWGHFNARTMDHGESMETEADEGFNGQYGPPFQDSGDASGSLPLERPWGYGQDEYHSGDPSNHPGNFSHDRAKDAANSWGVNNQ